MADEVLIKGRITGENRGAFPVIDAVAVGRQLFTAVIDLERGHDDAVFFKHHALLDFVGSQLGSGRGIIFAPNAKIGRVGERQVPHHLFGSRWPPYWQRHDPLSPRPADPAGKPQVGKADDMVRMVMREEHAADVRKRNADLMQPLHCAAARVEDEFLGADFHQRAGAEALQARRRRARAQQRDTEYVLACFAHLISPHYLAAIPRSVCARRSGPGSKRSPMAMSRDCSKRSFVSWTTSRRPSSGIAPSVL